MMRSVRRDLPSGTVTFLFTDVEGSTRLLHELGAEGYAEALAEHRRVIREACAHHDGVEVDTQGDAFFFAFPTAPGAISAAEEMTEALASGPIQVRIGLHTGTPLLAEEGYVGGDVHRAARIAAAGHGGQVLVSSSTAQLVELELADLGEHRLKDLSAPERIYQLGDGDFSRLATLHQTNLPIPATPFLGRERELDEVVGLVSQDGSRLLTLTGPGGTGKTWLALQAAGASAERYPQGVFWVALSPLRDPELVLQSASQALGAKNGLAEHIGDMRLLLLFDNFEHLLPAASGLAELLSSCPNLELLVTSREPLHVSGEQEYAVPPFAHEEAVDFFAARARAVDAAFEIDEAVPEICRRLDDLPLALELAAVRVKALTPAKILERLEERLPLLTGGARDAPERQRTLRATIEWSYDLLSDEEQGLFARLAVFRGGCTLEAAEAICEADIDTLQSLVDKSLVRYSNERYWMLETIREYAVEQLEASGETDALRRRHAEWFLALAEEAYPHLTQSAEWLHRLDDEHDNLRAALDRLEAASEPQLNLQLAGPLGRFWYLRSHVVEGRRRLETALAADLSRTAPRARALTNAATIALRGGDTAAAKSWAGEAQLISRELDDAWGIAYARYLLGNALATEGQWARAQETFEESRRAFRELGDDHNTLIATRALAWMHEELGDVERYRALTEENLELARATGNQRMEARALKALAQFVLEEGRIGDALSMQREALRIDVAFGEFYGIALDLSGVAMTFAATGRGQESVELVSSVQTLHVEKGAAIPSYLAGDNDKAITMARAELDEAAFAEAWERGRMLTLDEAVALALATELDA